MRGALGEHGRPRRRRPSTACHASSTAMGPWPAIPHSSPGRTSPRRSALRSTLTITLAASHPSSTSAPLARRPVGSQAASAVVGGERACSPGRGRRAGGGRRRRRPRAARGDPRSGRLEEALGPLADEGHDLGVLEGRELPAAPAHALEGGAGAEVAAPVPASALVGVGLARGGVDDLGRLLADLGDGGGRRGRPSRGGERPASGRPSRPRRWARPGWWRPRPCGGRRGCRARARRLDRPSAGRRPRRWWCRCAGQPAATSSPGPPRRSGVVDRGAPGSAAVERAGRRLVRIERDVSTNVSSTFAAPAVRASWRWRRWELAVAGAEPVLPLEHAAPR